MYSPLIKRGESRKSFRQMANLADLRRCCDISQPTWTNATICTIQPQSELNPFQTQSNSKFPFTLCTCTVICSGIRQAGRSLLEAWLEALGCVTSHAEVARVNAPRAFVDKLDNPPAFQGPELAGCCLHQPNFWYTFEELPILIQGLWYTLLGFCGVTLFLRLWIRLRSERRLRSDDYFAILALVRSNRAQLTYRRSSFQLWF
jgi:hypothetical protein